jgi:lipopolysaccharide export system ATP-binding protein
MGALLASGLVKAYGGRRVVDTVTVNVLAGEIVGLLGRNGAGKSTTFSMIAGLARPDSGDISIDGRTILDVPLYARARLGLTYLPQERSVFLKLRVIDNLLLPLEENGTPRRARMERAHALLDRFSLAYAARLPAHALSGGEARKLEVARALALDPRYILLDEPFAGMDPLHVTELQQVIRQLARDGIGVLMSDHNVFSAFEVIDRGYIIDTGRVLVEGTPSHLARSEQARVAFLGAEFRVPPVIESALDET